jgi:hypothetical protein
VLQNQFNKQNCLTGCSLILKKIWHPYWEWEDWKAGMWRKVSAKEERKFLPIAVEFTGNHVLYGTHMMAIVTEWPVSCEHNLTDASLNKIAWIGHAACAHAKGIPEYIVRRAWSVLSDEQRDLANERSEMALSFWRKNFRGGKNDAQISLFL